MGVADREPCVARKVDRSWPGVRVSRARVSLPGPTRQLCCMLLVLALTVLNGVVVPAACAFVCARFLDGAGGARCGR